ncbi:MAG: hypothetical protein GX557_00615, partial [Chloroflexi bacterium]|nr:hypothetical protein [Chloroflexota bacterium]
MTTSDIADLSDEARLTRSYDEQLERESEREFATKPRSIVRYAASRFVRNRIAVAGLLMVVAMVV